MGVSIPIRILLLLLPLAAVPRGAAATPAAPAPNILLLYLDNVGYGDLGCYGNREVLTPRVDRLAQEGVRCLDFQIVATSCTPSRGALLTGRHPLRNGLVRQLASTENWNGVGLPHREKILPQYLREAGYATGCFGKWNIGFAPGSRPTERGFDEFLGFRSGNIGYYEHLYNGVYDMFRGTEPHRVEGYSTDIFADAAIEFIRRQTGRPWFVYLPFNAAHFVSSGNVPNAQKPIWPAPGHVFQRYGREADEPDEKRRYRAVLTALDEAIGRVLDVVDRLELSERTLVMLISDNGAFMLPGRGLEVASNAPLRSGGTTCYEGGTRVPAIFRWPGTIPAGVEARAMLTQLDVVPLCLAVSGAVPLPGRILDGHNPLPALSSPAKSPHTRMGFGYDKGAAYREGDLKILREHPDSPWQLFDLASDIGESCDLAGEKPADVARLAAEYRAWLAAMKQDASPPAPWPPVPGTTK